MRSTLLLCSLFSVSQARTFYLDTGSNAVCFQISNPTSIEITKTLGTEPLPLALFEYNHRNALPGLPNFDSLITDAKLDEYFEFGEFTFKSIDSSFAYETVLETQLEFEVGPNVWCLYSPKISSFEYMVEIDESGYFEKEDDLMWLVVNTLISLFFAMLFHYRSSFSELYKLVINLQLAKVAVFVFTSILVGFNLNVAKYAEYISASLDDIFTMMFLQGYGFRYDKADTQTFNKSVFITLLSVIPAFATRYFDLKNNINYISINNRHYNVVQGVLGSEVYDGLDRVARLARETMVNRSSGFVSLLFAISKIIKIVSYIYAMSKTLKSLNRMNSAGKRSYISSVVVWLFIWSLVSVAMAPDLFYNYTNVTNYAEALSNFIADSGKRRYITLLWDESHWLVFWLIWNGFNGGKGLITVDKGDVKSE
ncbi:hypothetical protein I9W82_000579 [Candida metapsilosis]|uniref:Uncharacterized protein n=1 Tax=Candida metapsilosis TaxID=273372 RepID=A0A8H7ZKR2_9ASCO|nr:hypothetical protein I9W82_000579 [Candida metapsilosis]